MTKKSDESKPKRKIQSRAKLGIAGDNGWSASMRTVYFNLHDKFNKAIIKNDYTDKMNRPANKTKHDVKKKGATNAADGIWSDAAVDSVKSTADMFVRFTVEKDREKQSIARINKQSRHHEVRSMEDFNENHVKEFLQHKLDSGCTPKTVDDYRIFLQKAFESTFKAGNRGHKDIVNDSHREMIPEKRKSERVRNKGKNDGMVGHSLDQAQKLIAAASEDLHVRTGLKALTVAALRKDTFFKLKWKDVLTRTSIIDTQINLTENGIMKNDRKQIIPLDEKYGGSMAADLRSDLQSLWATRKFKEDDLVFGKNESGVGYSSYQFEKAMKQACETSGVDFKAYHAFKSASCEYVDKTVIPNLDRENLVKGILKMVNVQVQDKNGNWYKPHNPIVEQKEKRYITNKKTGKRIVKYVKTTDSTGHPVSSEKYTYENLMKCRIDFLRNLFTSEWLGHNRPDANYPYRNYMDRGKGSK